MCFVNTSAKRCPKVIIKLDGRGIRVACGWHVFACKWHERVPRGPVGHHIVQYLLHDWSNDMCVRNCASLFSFPSLAFRSMGAFYMRWQFNKPRVGNCWGKFSYIFKCGKQTVAIPCKTISAASLMCSKVVVGVVILRSHYLLLRLSWGSSAFMTSTHQDLANIQSAVLNIHSDLVGILGMP